MLKLAQAILDAQKIREESYNHEAALKAKGFVDFEQFYEKSIYESADEASLNAGFDLSMTQPIISSTKI